MLSGHFQNSLKDDWKPVVTDTNTKRATENKVNGDGRSVCDTEKQRRPSFKKRNQEILKMEKTFCGPLFSSFIYLSTVTHIHLAIYLIIIMKKLMFGSALSFRLKREIIVPAFKELIVQQRLKKNMWAEERRKGWVKDTNVRYRDSVCITKGKQSVPLGRAELTEEMAPDPRPEDKHASIESWTKSELQGDGQHGQRSEMRPWTPEATNTCLFLLLPPWSSVKAQSPPHRHLNPEHPKFSRGPLSHHPALFRPQGACCSWTYLWFTSCFFYLLHCMLSPCHGNQCTGWEKGHLAHSCLNFQV